MKNHRLYIGAFVVTVAMGYVVIRSLKRQQDLADTSALKAVGEKVYALAKASDPSAAIDASVRQLEEKLQANEALRTKLASSKAVRPGEGVGAQVYTISAPTPEDLAFAVQAKNQLVAESPETIRQFVEPALEKTAQDYTQWPVPHRVLAVYRFPTEKDVKSVEMFQVENLDGLSEYGITGNAYLRTDYSTDQTMPQFWGRRYGQVVKSN